MELKPHQKIIHALDVDSPEKAMDLVQKLFPLVGCFKIGLEFITAMLASLGPPEKRDSAMNNFLNIRRLFYLLDGNVLWDGKFDDIPSTVGKATAQVKRMGLKMLNLHASAGVEAIVKAVENKGSSLLFGVTVLTSLDEEACKSIFGAAPGSKVLQFADMLLDAGADGIICSPQELKLIRSRVRYKSLLTATPGIRPSWAAKGDQQRIMTPADAVKAGADYIIIGRPIRQPPPEIGTSEDAARKIAEEIAKTVRKEK